MKLILHIGWPKTGTTSFQNWLLGQEKRLAEQGVFYPRTGRWPSGSHNELALALKPIEGYSAFLKPEVLWAQLTEEIRAAAQKNKFHTVFLTSELMPPLHEYPAILAMMRSLCSEMSVLAVAREQVSMLKSLYRQLVCDTRIRMTSDIMTFFRSAKGQLLYHEHLTRYRASEAWLEITAFKYGDGVIESMIRFLGWDAPAGPVPVVRVSAKQENVEVVRLLNAVEMPLKRRSVVNDSVLSDPLNFKLQTPELSTADIETIRSFYRQSNESLLHDYGVDLSADE